MERLALIPIERTSKMPRGGVNRQSATKNHFKTVRRRLSTKTPGISPETPGFVSGDPDHFPRDSGYETTECKQQESEREK